MICVERDVTPGAMRRPPFFWRLSSFKTWRRLRRRVAAPGLQRRVNIYLNSAYVRSLHLLERRYFLKNSRHLFFRAWAARAPSARESGPLILLTCSAAPMFCFLSRRGGDTDTAANQTGGRGCYTRL